MRVFITSTTFSIWTTVFLFLDFVAAENFTCYQCKRKANVECREEDLLPCPPIYDRCVTHITKEKSGDFMIKRECGLAPCGFNDAMVDKGLGLDTCDRSKHEYSCILCCKGSGCNKSAANSLNPFRLALITHILIVIINVAKNYFPPYVLQSDDVHK